MSCRETGITEQADISAGQECSSFWHPMPGLCSRHVLDIMLICDINVQSQPQKGYSAWKRTHSGTYVYRREFHSVGAISRAAKQFLARAINLPGEPSRRGKIPGGKTRHGYKSRNRYDIFCYTVSARIEPRELEKRDYNKRAKSPLIVGTKQGCAEGD